MELFRALGALVESPGPAQVRLAGILELTGRPAPAAYTELFVLQLPPYASLYVGAQGMLGGEARERVAGFWRALGHGPPAEPDHLATLMGLYAELAEREAAQPDPARRQLLRRARHALLWEHLASWLPPYLDRVEELGAPAYRAWAALMRRALAAQAAVLGVPDALPTHLVDAPDGLSPDDAHPPDRLVAALLTPVRSGLILTRADLAAAARQLGLAVRLMERRPALRQMLEEGGGAMLDWLQKRAATTASTLGRAPTRLRVVADFWRGRALATASALACSGTGLMENRQVEEV
jgi:TorA maturation chaperone TorD